MALYPWCVVVLLRRFYFLEFLLLLRYNYTGGESICTARSLRRLLP